MLVASLSAADAFSCLDASGNAAEYWAALKGNHGDDTFFHDANTGGSFVPAEPMSGNGSAIIKTVNQFYGSLGASYAYAMYNDDPTGSASSSRAHSKGVLLFDDTKGFWLVHSFPKWPGSVEDGYAGLSSTTYGQSFLCVTFELSVLEKIASIQLMQWPEVYSSGVSDDLAGKLPNFASWIGRGKSTLDSASTPLRSYSGLSFTHYGKSKACACDLYEDIVAPGVGSGLLVESWQRQEKMPNFCTPSFKYSVQNVSLVTMSNGRSWKETQDHSKWAISSSGDYTACIGDINRMYSQEKRGGGTLCYQNRDLWSAFNSIVTSAYRCEDQSSSAASSQPIAV